MTSHNKALQHNTTNVKYIGKLVKEQETLRKLFVKKPLSNFFSSQQYQT